MDPLKSLRTELILWLVVGILLVSGLSELGLFGQICILILAIAVAGFFLWYTFTLERVEKREALIAARAREARIRQAVGQHHRVLLRKRRQGCVRDEYGLIEDTKWRKDLRHFVTRVLPTAVDPEDVVSVGEMEFEVEAILDEFTSAAVDDSDSTDGALRSAKPSRQQAGVEFEHRCAEILRSNGWTSNVTKASGDQGADIEAERDGYRIVIQCKCYSSPVGNGAVQEAVAARLHYEADRGVVVSQSSFTPSARQLAQTTNVLLVHVDDLSDIDSLLEGNPLPLEDGVQMFETRHASANPAVAEPDVWRVRRNSTSSLSAKFKCATRLVASEAEPDCSRNNG
ncbi:restriction endonuclease [Bordetella ansorpii]|uniref:restriction endonuclease n=1 Tax=Bordetella ansorpii TaxID=288768 RepID=UPI0012E8098C|nr:restriction endonuclease [Bordetella ansorpii]